MAKELEKVENELKEKTAENVTLRSAITKLMNELKDSRSHFQKENVIKIERNTAPQVHNLKLMVQNYVSQYIKSIFKPWKIGKFYIFTIWTLNDVITDSPCHQKPRLWTQSIRG